MNPIEQHLTDIFSQLPLNKTERQVAIAHMIDKAKGKLAIVGEKPLWTPLPGPQYEAYHCEADELFFGGSGGGGKTDLLLGVGLSQGKRSILFRREYPQLKDVIVRSRELLQSTNARYNGNLNIWFDVPGDRSLEFGATQHESDVEKYRGRPHDTKLFDEVTLMSEFQYRFLTGWARTTDPEQRVRIIAAGNPPTSHEGEWVIKRWGAWLDKQHPNPAQPGELRWYAMIDGNDTEVKDSTPFEHKGDWLVPKSRTFIPARLSDNPYLAETGYGAVLQTMPEPLRSQMLYGDFSVGVEDDRRQLIPTDWVRQAQRRWEENGKPEKTPLTSVGVDVARGGDDQSVIAKRHANWFARLIKYPGRSTIDGPVLAGYVVENLSEKEREATIIIDIIGVGSSPYDALTAQDLYVIGYNGAKKSHALDKTGRLRFINKRAESWWRMREALDPLQGEGIMLPPDSELLADLTAPHWKLTARGIQVESKEEIHKRLKRSPDCGDAVVMALEDTSVENYIQFF